MFPPEDPPRANVSSCTGPAGRTDGSGNKNVYDIGLGVHFMTDFESLFCSLKFLKFALLAG